VYYVVLVFLYCDSTVVMDINKHTLNISLFTYSVLCEFHAIIQLVWDSF